MGKLGDHFDLTTLLTSSVTVMITVALGFWFVVSTQAPSVLVLIAALAAGLFAGVLLAALINGARGGPD